jgi:biopolymer transport protein ExbD
MMRRGRKYWAGLGDDPLAVRPRASERHDRMIPMINVVFLLLTFFLIAGTMRAGDPLRIEPPLLAAEGAVDRQSPVLGVEADGTLYVQGRPMDGDRAIAALKQALAGDAGKQLHIKADRRTPAEIILPLLRRLRDSGIEDVYLIAVKTGD